MKFSIVVPIYNVDKYLYRCLSSIVAQTYRDYQVIMINDGSTDQSVKIAKQFTQIDKRFVLYSTENQGLAAARNEAFKYLDGEYVVFIDSDDQITSDYLEIINEAVISADVDLVHISHSKVTKLTKNVGESGSLKVEDVMNGEQALVQLMDGELYPTAWSTVVKRELIQKYKIRFSDGRLFEDENFEGKVYTRAKKVKVLETTRGPYIYLVNRSDSIMGLATKGTETIRHIQDRHYIFNDEYDYIKKYSSLDSKYLNQWLLKKMIWLYNHGYDDLHHDHGDYFAKFKNEVRSLYKKRDAKLPLRLRFQYYKVVSLLVRIMMGFLKKAKRNLATYK